MAREINQATVSRYILDLQQRIDSVADVKTKEWFESYLKHSIQYRGVKTNEVSNIIISWRKEHCLLELSPIDQLSIATKLITQNYAEDKFAGIIYIQKFLLRKLESGVLLEAGEQLFSEEAFVDWSTTDWFCIRVLGPTIKRHGINEAKRLAGWRTSSNLWQRRASIVPFRSVVKDINFHHLIIQVIEDLCKEETRFIQTGIGWVICDLSKKFPDLATSLVETHFHDLSLEVIRRHTKYLPNHLEYIASKRG